MLRRSHSALLGSLLVTACAAQAPATVAPTPATTGAKQPSPEARLRLGPHELPELPPAGQRSQAFDALLPAAERVFARTAPAPHASDLSELDAFMRGTLAPYTEVTIEGLAELQARLGEIGEHRDLERVIGIALYGLSLAHFVEDLSGLPMPAALRDEAELEAIYRTGLWSAALPFANKAVLALQACEVGGAEAWRALCEKKRAELQARVASAERAAAAAHEAQLARIQGPRPPGSQACWSPQIGAGPTRVMPEPTAPPVPAFIELDAVDPSRIPLLERERASVRRALREALAQRYAAAGVEVRWHEEAADDALIRQWAAGRALRNGPRCKRGVELSEMRRQSLPRLELANAWASCSASGSCSLQVDLGRGAVAAALGLQRLQAALEGPLTAPETWLKAAAALQPLPPGESVRPFSPRARARSGTALRLHELVAHGRWSQPSSAREVLLGATDALAACAALDADQPRELSAVLAIDASGAVRELWQPPALDAHRAQDDCVRAALRKLAFGADAEDRRVTLRMSLGHGLSETPRDVAFGALDLVTGARVSVTTEDNAHVSPAPLSGPALTTRLAACLAHKPDSTDTLELAVELDVAIDGRAKQATLSALPESTVALDAALQRCLRAALEQTRFECVRDARSARVKATICLRREEQPRVDRDGRPTHLDAPAVAP